MNNEKDVRKQELNQEIINLQEHLTSNTSPLGDWKMIKYQEYMVMGVECPYDMNEYHVEREAIRARINELQAELEAM